ncbi:MAG: thiamine diphosphokinase [Spirochaetaceae bacterium]|jgi:thiamine pyrophosphokinase|nr:thiamine diphosphokinase [Spirochaetaceae bacterium]
MKGLVFIGGEGPDAELCAGLAAESDIIVAADSGLVCAENLSLRPDWVIGDMDSLDDESRLDAYPPGRVIRFPADKDFTDTELALDLLFEQGCDEITLAGGGGGRLDHILAIAALFERERYPRRWFTAREKIYAVSGEFCCNTKKTDAISVFPLGNGPWKAQSTGLKWPLASAGWSRGFFGISNAPETETVTVRALSGRFLVLVTEFPPPGNSEFSRAGH